MDNQARMHRERYWEAEDAAVAGNHEKAVDVCLELRSDPTVGLYRRALVNLLRATSGDIRRFPDKAKFAKECIVLLAQTRKEHGIESEEEEERISGFERHAAQTISDIRLEEKDLAALMLEKKLGLAEGEWEKLIGDTVRVEEIAKMDSSFKALTAILLYREVPELSLEERVKDVLDKWTIEGTFTDPPVKEEESRASESVGATAEGGPVADEKEFNDDDEVVFALAPSPPPASS